MRIIFLLVDVDLRFEDLLAILSDLKARRESYWHHTSVSCLLLDRDDDFPILPVLLAEKGILHWCEPLLLTSIQSLTTP